MIRQGLSKTGFASKSGASNVSSARRTHILCADEHDDTREMMACWLDLCGYRVTTAGSIGETLPLTERGGFDLLLLSGWYRDGLGVDLCRQIRAFDTHTPIVFLSAYSYQADIKEGLESGAQAYLGKPVDLNELTQTIEQFALITDRDISSVVSTTPIHAAEIAVGEAISKGVFTCRPEGHVKLALDQMTRTQVNRLPAVTRYSDLRGILSLTEVMACSRRGAGAQGQAVSCHDIVEAYGRICELRQDAKQRSDCR